MTVTQTDRLFGESSTVAVKAPVNAVILANVPFPGGSPPTGLAALPGGYVPAEGDRILFTGQIVTTQNGIWNASAMQWSYAGDFASSRSVVNGTLIVAPNTAPAGLYQVNGVNPIVPGKSAITITPLGQGGTPYVTGGFVATLSGFSTVVTGTVQYLLLGPLVILYVPAPIGAFTSNSGSMILTGLPAFLVPTRAASGLCQVGDGYTIVPVLGQWSIPANTPQINFALGLPVVTAAGQEVFFSQAFFGGIGGGGAKGISAGTLAIYGLV